MAHTVDLSAAPTGRDNGRARQWASGIRQPGRNPRVGIVAPCQGFCRFARSTTRGCAKPPPRAIESGPYRAENAACPPRRVLRRPRFPPPVGRGIDQCPRPTVISPAPTGRDPIAQVAAAQAWDPGPPMAHTVDLSEAPTGRDNGRARQWASGIRQPGRNPRVGIVAPCQGFFRFARSTTRGCGSLRPGL